MKPIHLKLAASAIFLTAVFSCQKGEAENAVQTSTADYAVVSDSVSMAAHQQVADRKFLKTADINMEVKDLYDATIFIEKQLKELGGFVTVSRLNSNVISEDTFESSDSEATLVKKYQTENRIQARVPSEKLGDFLTRINDKKMFLNSRTILAEDVTNHAKIAQLEKQKLEKTGEVIGKMKNSGDKADRTEKNLEQHNQQQIADITLADDLNFSTVDIYIKEPKIRVAEILVTNTKNIDNKYKFNFFYDAKNAFVEGFYIIQRLLVGLITIWPLMLILGFMVYFLRRKKVVFQKPENE